MTTVNRERQQRFKHNRLQSGSSRIHCWLSEADKQRLHRLMDAMKEHDNGAGYTDVISRALKELEINLAPPGARNMVRYGLLFMGSVHETE